MAWAAVTTIMAFVLGLLVLIWSDIEGFYQSKIPVEDVLEISDLPGVFQSFGSPIVSDTIDFRDMSPTEVRGLFEPLDGYAYSLFRYPHPQNWHFLINPILSLRYDADNDKNIVIHLPITVHVTREEVPEHVDIIDLSLQQGAGIRFRSFQSVVLHNHIVDSSDNQSYTVQLDDTHPEIDAYLLNNEESEFFSIPIECRSPGVYTIVFEFPVEYQGEMSRINHKLSYLAVCPQTYTMWYAHMPAASETGIFSRDACVTADPSLNVRQNPGLHSDRITTLPMNSKVTVRGQTSELKDDIEWVQVRIDGYPAIDSGWVSQEHVNDILSGNPYWYSADGDFSRFSCP